MRMEKSKYRPYSVTTTMTYREYQLGRETIAEVNEGKDLGVIIQNNLSPEKHINRILGKTYNTLQNIGFAFNYLDTNIIKKILTTLIRPQ